MAFATRSRRATRAQSPLTVVPFDARGAGVGEVPATVAIELPGDGEMLLILCAEAERPDPTALPRCLGALDAFRAGFAAANQRALTLALLAGMEEANAALYDPRAARSAHRPVGIGLTALVVRGIEGYVIQTGPGQALILGDNGITALPPLSSYRMVGTPTYDEGASAPPLGLLSTVEPDLFHIEMHDGLFATLCVSGLGRVLHHEDDGPLRSADAGRAADYLVWLSHRYQLPQAYGVLISSDGQGIAPSVIASPPVRYTERASVLPTEAIADRWHDYPADPGSSSRVSDDDAPPTPAMRQPSPDAFDEPRWEYLGEPETVRSSPRRSSRFGGGKQTDWDDPYRPRRQWQVPVLPLRAWLLLGGLLLTLVLAALMGIVHVIGSHRANTATLHELDAIAIARAQAVTQSDAQAAYTALAGLVVRLDKVATENRETQRVTLERQQLTQALDTLSGVTRVTPRQVAALPHLDSASGTHRLILSGQDGKLYLYDKEKNDWGVYTFDSDSQKRERVFTTGSVANKVPAGELRGLFWANGPATSDRTRLFTRNATGGWSEIALPTLGDKRPTAIAPLGSALYMLDNAAGIIVRVPVGDGSPAKIWTTDAATAELRTAVDMASDAQMIWVLLADGRVRGFVGGTPAQVFPASTVPPVKDVTAITTNAASPYLYIAENGQNRILRIRKADGRIVQVLRSADGAPPLVGVQSLSVDEGRGTLWYVGADGIVTVPLPPVGGA